MKMKRREFLKKSALGAGGLLLGAQLGRAEAAPQKFFDPFAPVPLGKTDLKFSRITMGTGSHGGNRESNQTREGRDVFQKLLRDAHDRGVRTYDLADLYGSHSYLPPALDGIPRDHYHLSAKSGGTTAAFPNRNAPPPTWWSRAF